MWDAEVVTLTCTIHSHGRRPPAARLALLAAAQGACNGNDKDPLKRELRTGPGATPAVFAGVLADEPSSAQEMWDAEVVTLTCTIHSHGRRPPAARLALLAAAQGACNGNDKDPLKRELRTGPGATPAVSAGVLADEPSSAQEMWDAEVVTLTCTIHSHGRRPPAARLALLAAAQGACNGNDKDPLKRELRTMSTAAAAGTVTRTAEIVGVSFWTPSGGRCGCHAQRGEESRL